MDLNTLHRDAIALINRGQYVEAHTKLVPLLQQRPDFADGYFLLGIINSELGQFRKASQLIEKALSLQSNPEYLVFLAKCQSILGNYVTALDTVKRCIDAEELSFNALDTLGVTLSRIGDHQLALGCFERALQKSQQHAQVYYNYGVSLKFSGDFKAAEQAFACAIELQPKHYQAFFARSDLKLKSGTSERIDELLNQRHAMQTPEAQLHIGHALAIEYQTERNYDAAFTALEQAKQAWLKQLDYSVAQQRPLFNAALNAKLNCQTPANLSNRPIFVLGMPRSGTTLVERIVSGHSQVGTGGELQDFGVALKELTQSPGQHVLDEQTLALAANVSAKDLGERYLAKTQIIAPEQARFVDKLPFNFFYAPLITQALPNAKILCLLRNPMDTCLGNFRQLFSIHSPYYNYAYKLEWVAEFYIEFYRMMQTFAAQNDNVMLVDYEQLVRDPEENVKAILAHCDLPYEPQCVDVQNNKLPVSTASKVQVREPINTKSLGRWRQFEQQLQPVAELLKQANISF